MAHILIVDDERSIRRTLGEFLRAEGYEVVEAEDADVAQQRLREAEFDVVVTDIILPRVTGVELLRRIQVAAPHVQVVMMTGEPTVETAAESLRAGAADYLFKPISKAAILRAAGNAVRIKTLEDTRRRLEAENRAHQENLGRLVEERTALLRASEDRYRSLVETAFDWVWEVDAQGCYTYASPRVRDLLGCTPEELIGRTPFDLMPEEEARRVRPLFEQITARQKPFAMLENTNRHRDGRLVVLETSGTPVFSPEGRLVGYRGTDRDVTERKQAEEDRKQTLRWQQGISQVQQSLLVPAPLEDRLRHIADSIVRLFGADFCRVWLIQPGDLCERGCIHAEVKEGPHACRSRDRCLHLLASSGRYTHLDGKGHRRVPFGAYKIGRIASGGDHKFLTNDAQNDPLVHNHEWARELGLVSFAGYQLRIPGGEVLGVLAFFATHPVLPAEDALVDGLSSALAQVIQQARAGEALRDSEALYQSLVEQMPQSVFRKDREGRFLFGNQRFCQVVAHSLGEILGKTDADFFPPQLAAAYRQDDLRVMESGQALDQEEENVGADGRVVFVHIVKSPLRDASGSIIGIQGIFWDITARKQAETEVRHRQAELAAIFENSPVMMCLLDARHQLRRVNRTLSQFSGRPGMEVVNQRIGDFLGCVQVAEAPAGCGSSRHCAECPILELVRRAFQTGQDYRQVEGRCVVTRDGRPNERSLICSTARFEVGGQSMVLLCLEDVTEKKLTEAKLLRAQRVESIGSLASGLAHDLNNILTPIIMCAPMLQLEDTLENRRELAQTVESSAQRAVGIVKQLLSFARGKEGQKQPVQVRHLLHDLAKIARETFPRSICVEEICASDLWLVLADATQLHQVLLNLCVNARDAMPVGGTLRLRADNVILDEHFVAMRPEASPGPHLRIKVEDTGTGIPESVQEHIFESFFTTKGEGQGTGLGLTTVQGIVKDHKGFITFTTAFGQGTTFEIHLPAVTEAQPDAERMEVRQAIPRGHDELVLVVDDELAICDAARRSLERHGYAVLQAHNGIEAIGVFSAHQNEVRAVVTDVMMPVMDGVTLCRAVRALSPRTALIVSAGGLFGKPGADAMRVLEELGVRHILHKPHNADVLLETLAKALEESRSV